MLGRAERALAWTQLSPTGWAVATDEDLRMTVADDPAAGESVRSWPWVQVLGAAWDDPILELKIYGQPDASVQRLNLREGRTFPQVVRERIMQSLLVQVHVPMVGDKGVRFLARRDPRTDEVTWQQVCDAGIDPGNPAIATRISSALHELRLTYGV